MSSPQKHQDIQHWNFFSIQNTLNDYEVLSLVNTLKLKWGIQGENTLNVSMTIQT